MKCIGAEGGSRTPTSLSPLDPEPSASANSATSALCDSAYLKRMIHSCQVVKTGIEPLIDGIIQTDWIPTPDDNERVTRDWTIGPMRSIQIP